MSTRSQKPPALYEPGQLDKTRKNLGSLHHEESDRMMKVLGGEIGVEKYKPVIDEGLTKTSSKRQYVSKRSSQSSNGDEKKSPAPKHNRTRNTDVAINPSAKKQVLPTLSPSEKQMFNRLMTSSEYHIKPILNFWAMLFSFGRLDRERVSSSLIQKELLIHIQHIDVFIDAMQQLILATPSEYKKKITDDDDPHFKTLRFIYGWDTNPIKTKLNQLKEKNSEVTIEDTIPFIKELFRSLMRFYFLGEVKMTNIIKKLYATAIEAEGGDNEHKLTCAKQAAGEWIYIFGQIIKGLYPLLMRMTISECEAYPDFFTNHISKILKFLGMTKYDLVLPKKQKNADSKEQKNASGNENENTSNIAEPVPSKNEKTITAKKAISQNLEILERLFPQAGWKELEKIPDMYPYFHPLYQFREGFNLLDPANPLQITIVLLRIVEDFFQACRNITFNIDNDDDYFLKDDSLQKIISEWAQYREVLFEKILSSDLRDYVNHVYAQNDFKNSTYAKKQLSNWLWQMKYYFHPHLAFEIVFIERSGPDNTYKSLPQRVHEVVEIFSSLIRNSSTEEGAKKLNFNAPYHFDVENTVSYRLDILLGGKNSPARTNLNLMKYTLCALRTLDWWINDKESFAYNEEIKIPYRTEGDDGAPFFSVSVRSDQQDIFLHNAKKLMGVKGAIKKQGKTSKKPLDSSNNADSSASDTIERDTKMTE